MQMLTDNDITTKFYWGRPFMLSPTSEATITWEIPEGTPDGTYRIQHFGDHKQARPINIVHSFAWDFENRCKVQGYIHGRTGRIE